MKAWNKVNLSSFFPVTSSLNTFANFFNIVILVNRVVWKARSPYALLLNPR